jgi:hypothetical protein
MKYTVQPLSDSDWTGTHDAKTSDGQLIRCKSSVDAQLDPVKADKTYEYYGQYPVLLEIDNDLRVFLVYIAREMGESSLNI